MNSVLEVIFMNKYNQPDGMHTILRTIHNEGVLTDAANLLIVKHKQIEVI